MTMSREILCVFVADVVAMATEGQLTVEGGGGDSASDDEASGDDDHAITSSTSTSRAKTKVQCCVLHVGPIA